MKSIQPHLVSPDVITFMQDLLDVFCTRKGLRSEGAKEYHQLFDEMEGLLRQIKVN